MKRRLLISFWLLTLAGMGFFVYSAAHGAAKQESLAQPVFDGKKYIFEGGILYRRAGLVPQLAVSGTHYQMGKETPAGLVWQPAEKKSGRRR